MSSTVSSGDVVVSGVGVVCAAGQGFDAFRGALKNGRPCGVDTKTALPVSQMAGVPVEIPENPAFPDDRKAWLAFTAFEEAWQDAGAPDGARTSVFLGTGLSSVTPHELEEDAYPHLLADGTAFDREAMMRDIRQDRVAPRRHDPIRVTSELIRRLGATGPCGTSFSACAAAAQAIAEGLRTIRRGEADVAVVGGHDSMLHPFGLLSFVVLGALSPTLCRPFDKRRDGFLIGEGAAMLVLESAEHAQRRGVRAHARLMGAGTSVDGYNVTAPHPEGAGAERAMRAALADAHISGAQVDYVNAHATGTPVGDSAEAAAISRTIGSVPVSSIKGAIGHTIAAAGAIEAAACVAALEGGWMPGTQGLEELDPACPIRALVRPQDAKLEVVMSNSFGFGGQNAALVFGRA